MSDKTRHAIAARLAANRKATGVAIRAPQAPPKKSAKPVPVEEPVEVETTEVDEPIDEETAEEPSGTDG